MQALPAAEPIVALADASVQPAEEPRAPSRTGIRLPGPKKRTRLQHLYITSKMRESLARNRLKRQLSRNNATLVAASEEMGRHLFQENACLRVASGRAQRRGVALLVRKGGRRYWRGMSMNAMLNISFNKLARDSDSAKAFRMSTRHVRRVKKAVAGAILKSQLMLINRCRQAAAAARGANGKVRWAMVALWWDESTQKLKLSLHGERAHRASCHVMNSYQMFIFSNQRGDELILDINRPPVLLESTAGSCILEGLTDAPCIKRFKELETTALDMAKIGVLSLARDGATANDVVVEQLFAALPDNVLGDDAGCGNHRTKLAESSSMLAVGRFFISQMYSIALLFRMGPSYMRLLMYVDDFVEKCVGFSNMVRTPLPSSDVAFITELKRYLLWNFRNSYHWKLRARKRENENESDAGDPDAQEEQLQTASALYSSQLDEFFKVFNTQHSKALRHNCVSKSCCQNYSIPVLRQRMARVIKSFVFAHMVTVPNKAKWTKTGPAVDWFLISGLSKILPTMWPGAFGKVQLSRISLNAAGTRAEPADEAKLWRELRGKRIKAGASFMQDSSTHWTLTVAALSMEPFRYLTTWFFRASSRRRRSRPSFWRTPPLCLLVTRSTSPVTRTLQHFATLLRGEATRLCLLWRREGHTDFKDFCEKKPEVMAQLRRACTCAASWVYRRLWAESSSWPKRLSVLANEEALPEEIDEVLEEFRSAEDDELDYYFGLRIRQKLDDVMLLREDEWVAFLRRWAWLDPCSIAPIEFKHGRDQRRCHENMSWSTFAASAVNEESALTYEALNFDAGAKHAVSTSTIAEPSSKRARTRRKEPRELHRLLYIEKRKLQPGKFNVASTEFADEVRRAFDNLTQAELDDITTESENMPDMPWKDYLALRNGRQVAPRAVPAPGVGGPTVVGVRAAPTASMALWHASASEVLDPTSLAPSGEAPLHADKLLAAMPKVRSSLLLFGLSRRLPIVGASLDTVRTHAGFRSDFATPLTLLLQEPWVKAWLNSDTLVLSEAASVL